MELELDCPKCGQPMTKNKHGVYECKNCNGVYFDGDVKKSIFGAG